ncbi:AMP-binding protein [Mycolicibacterium sphagni]|nr:AMP-binding protein [Mycolicibacterium sphagni]
MGAGGAPAPSQSGVAGARSAADGIAFRSRSRRPGRSAGRHLGNGSAVGRGCRRVHRQVRHPRPDVLRSNGIRRRCGRLDAGRPPDILEIQAGQRRPGQPGRPAAGGVGGRYPHGARRGRPAGGQARSARDWRPVGTYHRPGAHRRRWIPLDPGAGRPGHHPRRLQSAARRRAGGVGESPRGAGCRGGGPARRTTGRHPRCDGRVAQHRPGQHRRPHRVSANPAGALRDSVGDRGRRSHSPDTFGEGRSDRGPGTLHRAVSTDTVGRLLQEQAGARGDHPLLVCDAERLTYGDAELRSAELARSLIALGAGKGTHIGLLYPNGAGFVVAMLAAARIGAVVVPFSTFSTEPELRHQLVHSDTEILLATPSFRGHDYRARLTAMSAPWLRHIVFETRIGDPAPAELDSPDGDVDGCDLLAIVYTSGSTGPAKGVVHTHEALLGHQRNLNEIRGLTEQDRLFCNSPFFWIGGLAFGLLATMVAGSTLVCSNATDPGAVLDLLEELRPTVTNGFAAGIAHLARHDSFAGRDLSSMRRGNLYPIMAPDVRPRDPELRHNMLGMTEAGSVVLLSGDDTDQPEQRRGSFGTPAPGFDTRVVDPDTGTPVGVGEVGELCIRGRYLMQHYYKRSREDCFDADGWFHTGDLFRTDADGFFYFVGRHGSMIKTAGANVFPGEVEKAITKATGGLVAHVLPLPDPGRGQVVAAVVIVPAGGVFDESALRAKLKAELSSYKIPKRFATLSPDALPLTSSGKLDLPRLAAVFDD